MACEDLSREALEPFAIFAADMEIDRPGLADEDGIYAFKAGDFRRARTAYDAIGSGVKALPDHVAQHYGDLGFRIVDFFDKDETAGSFLREDGEGGFVGGAYRMAREIDALRSALPTHTAAGAGPVGEAVAWRRRLKPEFNSGRSGFWEYREKQPLADPHLYEIEPLYARTVEEPGEVERLREGEARLTLFLNERAIEWSEAEGRADTAEAALAETREALTYIARKIDAPDEVSAPSLALTFWKETVRDMQGAARAALTGDAQEGGR